MRDAASLSKLHAAIASSVGGRRTDPPEQELSKMTYMTPLGRRTHHAEGRRFIVTQNEHGYWVASETRGLIEGVFISRRDAIRFALFEGGSRSVVIAGGSEISPR